jgi:hypothetical protein
MYQQSEQKIGGWILAALFMLSSGEEEQIELGCGKMKERED